jgi:photosystem II stability/assembly factor-like uncharacterized protein
MKKISENIAKTIAIIPLLIVMFIPSKIHTQELDANQINEPQTFYEARELYQKSYENIENKKGAGWKQFKRWEYFWDMRTWPDGKFPDMHKQYKAIVKTHKESNDVTLALKADWKEIGPINTPQNQLPYKADGLGRLNCVTIHPQNSDIIWVGAAAGGAWKTTNGGSTWIEADMTNFLSIGVSYIEISKTDPNLMFIASGDANGISMTSNYSLGILKSTDAGETWNTTGLNNEIQNRYIAGKVLIHPENENIVFAVTSSGIYKSEDAGENWSRKQESYYFKDIEFMPGNTDVLYATTRGNNTRIFKSEDAGENWVQKISFPNANRAEIAVSPDDPQKLYALASSSSTRGLEGFYRSDDAGETWKKMQGIPNILSRDVLGDEQGGQGHYDLALEVAPYDADIVWTGGIHVWRSTDGGENWEIKNHWTASYGLPYVHADIHYLKFDQNSLDLYTATDGGLYKTQNQGSSWQDLSDGLSIMQFYKIDYSRQKQNFFIGGSQDNGSNMFINNKWFLVYGGDGMTPAMNPQNDQNFYVSTPNGTFYRTENGGQSFGAISWQNRVGENANWLAPIVINHENPDIVYTGYQNVFKSTDRGGSWSRTSSFGHSYYQTIQEIALAPSNPDIIYCSARGALYRKIEDQPWEKVLASGRTISDIAVDNSDPYRIWFTTSSYESEGKVMEFDGKNLYDISDGLPPIPANTIVHNKGTNRELFCGTDAGVYYYDDDSNRWILFNNGMPYIIVSDLHIDYASGNLIAGTFARGIWETKVIDCDINIPTVRLKGKTEFCEGDSLVLSLVGDHYRYEWSTGATSESIVIKESGDYYVRVFNAEGCAENSQIVNVNVYESADIRILSTSSDYICGNDTITLTAIPRVEKFEWSTGDTTQIIKITEPGKYWVKGISENGCISLTDELILEYSAKPEIPSISVTAGGLKSTEAFEYQWYLDGKKIVGADEQYFLPDEDMQGDFYVEVFNEAGCSSISESIFYEFTNINEINSLSSNAQIVPNPNNGSFDLVYKDFELGKLRINITDILGNSLLSKTVLISDYNGNLSFVLPEAAPGVYYLNLNNNNKLITLKLIKQNE